MLQKKKYRRARKKTGDCALTDSIRGALSAAIYSHTGQLAAEAIHRNQLAD